MGLRYLAGEEEDMIDTGPATTEFVVEPSEEGGIDDQVVVEKQIVLKQVMSEEDDLIEVVHGELVVPDEDDEEDEDNDELVSIDSDLIDNIADAAADVILQNILLDGLGPEQIAYIVEEIQDSISHAFSIADFTQDSFQCWYDTHSAIGLRLERHTRAYR